jgi:hypothetical protein
MTARDLSAAIEPGSLPYGARQQLEANLPQALAGGAPEEGGGGELGGPVAIPEDPIGALLSGEVEPDQEGPVTEGLSVGLGAGPFSEPDEMMSSRAEKLRMLAQEASSPLIQQAARNELRRMAREPI